MAKGIVLRFDATTTTAIRACWRRLEAAGIPSLESFTHRRHEPHISLVVADEIVVGDWLAVLRAAFPGGWVYLGATRLPASAHARLVTTLGQDAKGVGEHYLPQNWVPHCTLAGDLGDQQVTAAIDVIGSIPLPGLATVMPAALIDSEAGGVRLLHEHAAATAST